MTEVRGLQRSRPGLDQARRLELEIIALLLLEPRHLPRRLKGIVAEVDGADPDSALLRFAAEAEACSYDESQLLSWLAEQEEGSIVFERLLGSQEEGPRIDLEEQLAKALSLLRELRLDGQKELSRTRLEARVAELTTLLAGEGLSEEDLNGFYAELQEIQSVLAARDAERRLRVPASFNRQRRRR